MCKVLTHPNVCTSDSPLTHPLGESDAPSDSTVSSRFSLPNLGTFADRFLSFWGAFGGALFETSLGP